MKRIPWQPLAANGVTPVGLSPREKLHIRTRELAVVAGRRDFEITQVDYEQAKRDVTGEVDLDRQNAVLGAGGGKTKN